MKENIHPKYQEVLFVDSSTGQKFICGSTLQPKEKEKFEGKEYPLVRVATSSYSHPFFTKTKQFMDTEGRVDKFTKKYAKMKEQVAKVQEKVEEKKKTEEDVKKKKKTSANKG